VAGPLKKLPSHQSSQLETVDQLSLSVPRALVQPSQSVSLPYEPLPNRFSESLPCVLYECNASFELTYVSENAFELLGINASELVGNGLLSNEIIPDEDLVRLSDRVSGLQNVNGIISLVHRILDRRGLPSWVAHDFWKVNLNNTTMIKGCMVPMDFNGLLNSAEQVVISRFVHKMGNHFQLLNLIVNSLRRTVPESRETLLLQETVEKTIDLARSFSDYNQVPTGLFRVELMDVLEAAAMTRRYSFEKKEITFNAQIHASLRGATIQADPYLLELAIGHVLQNALEATETGGGQVTLQARAKRSGDNPPVASISVIDSGCGIDENALKNVLVPFFTCKKNHDGLGLSMASRFIEIHGGILRIKSAQGKGTEVEIVLPIGTDE
jgi:signal transduction histidine kinase